jgi:glycosyltransferase involved in cell wall biosynthesis
MTEKLKVLHVISDIATPHNNVLMTALQKSGKCTLHLYYSKKTTQMYSWGGEVFQEVGQPVELGKKKIYWPLIWLALSCPQENYLFIGWPNTTARLLLLIFWFLHRSFLFWSDYPNDSDRHYPFFISCMRSFLYHIVKTRAHRIFLVGQHTVELFKTKGYPELRLANLPIFTKTDKTKADYCDKCAAIRNKYKTNQGEVLFVSGSRLTQAKAFRDLYEAVSIVKKQSNLSFRVIIVGKGEQEEELKDRIADLDLSDTIIMEPWMTPEDFIALIACADVYIHPARFDAFGGGTLHAMALGVPVIGSDGAGAVVERVVHEWNGLVFRAGQATALASCMLRLLNDPETIAQMGYRARKTAEEWPPERGGQIICDALL